MRDPVTSLPPAEIGYHHTGRQIWYTCTKTLEYQVCDGSGEDEDCNCRQPGPMEDHLLYMNLWGKCQRQGAIKPRASNCDIDTYTD